MNGIVININPIIFLFISLAEDFSMLLSFFFNNISHNISLVS